MLMDNFYVMFVMECDICENVVDLGNIMFVLFDVGGVV